MNESNSAMETFLNQRKCKNIIKSKTCYKSQEGSCIDLIIINRQNLSCLLVTCRHVTSRHDKFSHAFETGTRKCYVL